MPKVAYSEEERDRIRSALITTALDLMAHQGIQHTTVEQIYRSVGISRTFFYTFFPSKEDLIVETLYLQQPRILAYAKSLMADSALSWREAVRQFVTGKLSGIPSKTVPLVRQSAGMLWNNIRSCAHSSFHESQSDCHGDSPCHPPNPAAVCS